MNSKKNENIQFMRGISILLVLTTHVLIIAPKNHFPIIHEFNRLFRAGMGVDIFFLISGYLMGVTFLSKVKSHNLKTSFDFYRKRFNRIFLPTFAWALLILMLSPVWVSMGVLKSYDHAFATSITSMLFVNNFYSALNVTSLGYFWSISTEAQFYLVLPILTVMLRRFFWYGILGLLIYLSFFSPIPPKDFWLFRFTCLLIGLCIWKISTQPEFSEVTDFLSKVSRAKKAILYLALTLASAYMYKLFGSYSSVSVLIAGVVLTIPFVVMAFSDERVFGFLSIPIEKVGAISFSLYLCHMPVWLATSFLLMKVYPDISPLTKLVLCLSASFLIAKISYELIENRHTSRAVNSSKDWSS